MFKTLLIITGAVNLLFGLFHVYLAYAIYRSTGIPMGAHGMLEAFSVFGCLALFFLAYACLARGHDVLRTGLGAAVLVLGALIYLTRAAEEFFWFAGNMAIFYACLIAGVLHIAVLAGVRLTPPVAET